MQSLQIMQRHIFRLAILTMLVMLFTGCGFHLRGSPALYGGNAATGSYSLQTPIVIRYPKSERAWASRLRIQFERSGIETIDAEIASTEESPFTEPERHSEASAFETQQQHSSELATTHYPILTILKSEQLRRIASYTSRAKAAEYTLTENLSYQISGASGQLIVAKNTLSSNRVYEFNVNNISGKDQEADLIIEELQQDITLKLIRHLSNIADQLNVGRSN